MKTLRAAISLIAILCVSSLYARTLYVDNVNGSDSFSGLVAVADPLAMAGPFQSIRHAFSQAQLSDRIEVINTGVPYRGGNVLNRVGGTADKPMVIEGNGAVISGLARIEAQKWVRVSDRIFKTPFWPMSNRLKGDTDFSYWIGTPQIWWVDGAAALNCHTQEELFATAGGFFWNKAEKTVWFHLPEGKTIEGLEVLLPVYGTGLNISGKADNVVVQNFKSMYSWNDGFSAHGDAKNLVLRNCIAVDNCGQGFSMHDRTRVLVEDSYAARNASSGACDVNHSQVTYRRSVLVNNTFEAGVYATEATHTYYEDCLIVGNAPFEQVWQFGRSRMVFINSVIAGGVMSDKPLLLLRDGNLTFIQSTLVNGGSLVDLSRSGKGTLVLDHCAIAGISGPVFGSVGQSHQLTVVNSVFDRRLTLSRGAAQGQISDELAAVRAGIRLMEIVLEGELGVQLSVGADLSAAGERYGRPARIGAHLPQSVWDLYEAGKAHPQEHAARGAL